MISSIVTPKRLTRETKPVTNISRNIDVDILKGLGIIFVILGHMGSPLYGGDSILVYIYTFHMPLFFVVMGYLAVKITHTKFGEYARKKAKGLLIPYTLFFLFSFLWTNTVYPLGQGLDWFSFPFQWGDFVQAFFLSGGYLEKIPLGNFPLWFLPLCFATTLFFYGVVQIKDKRILVAATIIIALATIPIQNVITGRPAWHINVLPAALFFMLVGYLYRLYGERLAKYGNSFLAIGLIVFGYVLSLGLGMGASIAHVNTYSYFLCSLISIYGYYMLARESQNKYLAYIGRNSLYFFSLHALVLLELPALKIDQFFIGIGEDGVIIYIIQLLSVLLLTTALVAMIRYAAKKLAGVAITLRTS